MDMRNYFTIPRLYPIWVLAMACIAGIWWQSFEYPWYYTCIIALGGLVLLMTVAHVNLALKPVYICLYVLVFLGASASYQLSIWRQKNFCQKTHNRHFDIMGIVTDICQTGNYRLPIAIKLDIHSMTCTDATREPHNTRASIFLYTKKIGSITVSDTIEVKNILFKTPKNKDFMRYLIKEGVETTVTINQEPITVIEHPSWSINRSLIDYRNHLLLAFQQSMDKQTYLSFGSIFLGNPVAKKRVEEMKNQLKMWGLFHYIARAGLHLVIFISIWMFLLGLLPIAWLWRQLTMILLATIYFIFTWPSIPFNRAFFTFLMTKVITIFGIRAYYIPSLSLIVIITLLIHPMYLFCLDFQLSFGITYALAWFNEIRTQRHS